MNSRKLFPVTALALAMALAVHADNSSSPSDDDYWVTRAEDSQPSGKGKTVHGIEYLFRVKVKPSESKRILGISGIRYNPKTEKIILVSDDTGIKETPYGQGKARYYEIPRDKILNIDQPAVARNFDTASVNEVELKHGERTSQWLNDGHVDLEGVEIMKDGRLIMASEQGAAGPFYWSWKWSYGLIPFPIFWNPNKPDWAVKPKLLIVDDKNGTNSASLHLPYYYQNTGWYFDYGVRRNKGIEAITRMVDNDSQAESKLDVESQAFMVMTETALAQDEQAWSLASRSGPAPCRMLFFSLDELTNKGGGRVGAAAKAAHVEPYSELLYQITHLSETLTDGARPGYPKQGVSDAKSVSQEKVLVLERSYVKYSDEGKKPHSVARIYIADIRTGHNVNGVDNWPFENQDEVIPGGVKEIANMDLVEKKPLFDSVDFEHIVTDLARQNIEGMELIPLGNDQQLLVLVNDGDASSSPPESTYLTFFLVPNALLKE
ncbi:MAG: esterase-like activity of phytase family protein [Endozoicomonas sp.]